MVFGASWFLFNDIICNRQHGNNSVNRYYAAYALQGGLMTACLYHPSAILYGMIMGVFFGNSIIYLGGCVDSTNHIRLPKGFVAYMPNFDEEKRRNALRDDEEFEMSFRSCLD